MSPVRRCFGQSVSVNGDTALIGAIEGFGLGTGSAYVFTRSAGVWSEQAKLTASDAAAVDLFEVSVSVGVDTVLIGALFNDDAGDASGSD